MGPNGPHRQDWSSQLQLTHLAPLLRTTIGTNFCTGKDSEFPDRTMVPARPPSQQVKGTEPIMSQAVQVSVDADWPGVP